MIATPNVHRIFAALALLGILVVVPSRAAGSAADAHLLAGAKHFRDGRFAEALVEFRVAERLGAEGEAVWYTAAALLKLGRAEDAVENFLRAQEVASGVGDSLLEYYRAMAMYEARLYLSADRILGRLAAEVGPRIAEQVREVRGRVATALSSVPDTAAIDWYLDRAQRAVREDRGRLAKAYVDEAQALSSRRQDRYRSADLAAMELRARSAGEGRTR
ncbi:MAG TPA: hypothetical protein VE549_10835 [Myxococcaceae bacterium]|nr:hypothetical protein [Myxococcaceae bacterium]